MNKERVEAKIRAYNRAAKRALELHDSLSDVFKQFVGQKVLKGDGSFLAKVAGFIPFMEKTPELMIYRYQSNYSMCWVVKACEQVQGQCGCEYMEVPVYVGEGEGNVLKSLIARPDLRHDYTFAEYEKKHEAFKAAQKKLDEAKSALHPFGEF